MNIGMGFKKLRNELNMTQREFSTKTGMSRSYLGNLENNRGEPSIKTIRDIVEKTDIDVVDFLIDYCGVNRNTQERSQTK